MSDKDADKAKEVDKTEDFEKRYNDSQTHITKIEDENAALRDSATKDKELFETVSPYIDWDAVNGKKTATVDDDGYVDKKTLDDKIKDLQGQIQRNATTQNFRSKFPDMVQYEDLIADPVDQAHKLYGFLGVTSTDYTDSRIEHMVGVSGNDKYGALLTPRIAGLEEIMTRYGYKL